MKITATIIIAFTLFSFGNTKNNLLQNNTIDGKVIDAKSKEALIICPIKLFQNENLITQTESDFDGNFSFFNLANGSYQLKTSSTGYKTDSLINIELIGESRKWYNIELSERETCGPVKILAFKPETIVRNAKLINDKNPYIKKNIRRNWMADIFGTIQGIVTNIDSSQALIGASVELLKDNKSYATTTTDIEGQFSFNGLLAGTYRMIVTYTGYTTNHIEDIMIKPRENQKHIITMDESAILDEVTIVGYKVPLIAYDNTTSGSTKSSSSIKSSTDKYSKNLKEESKSYKNKLRFSDSKIKVRGGRTDATFYCLDGIRVHEADASKLIPQHNIALNSERLTKETITSKSKSISQNTLDIPDAGQLTAAEWNDLNNWNDWETLTLDGEYQMMNDYWGLTYKERYSVFVTNKLNLPVVNSLVQLKTNSDSILWEAKTDNKGRAELWADIDESVHKILTINYNNETYKIKNPKTSKDGSNYMNLPTDCSKTTGLDIMFVVDATGSMGDEINFLRSELSDVIEKLKDNFEEETNLRLGSVFYKDKDDDYQVKATPLDADIEECLDFIKTKSAGGGGDFPEAVDLGLQAALDQDWNESATNRIIFLLLDAPPHHNSKSLDNINTQIKEAAKNGIKIIPITASGIDRETEFLMKQISILTNGTYVFITDDSGIGDPHLEPITPDYEVELLNELLLRLLSNYIDTEDCQSPIAQIANTEINIYPNPATKYFTLETTSNIDELQIYSSTGMKLYSTDNIKKGINRIELTDYPAGMYTIKLIDNSETVWTSSLMIIST